MSAERPTLEELRAIDLFDDLSDDEVERWRAVARIHVYAPGEVFVEADEPRPSFQLLLAGTAVVMLVENDRVEVGGQHVAPTWMGAIAVLTETPMNVRIQAETELRVADVGPADFMDLTLTQRSVHRRVMAMVRPVAGRIASREQNRERLASLGTMAAGLAHELNNPAAAAQRAASDLAETLDVLGGTVGHFVRSGVEREEAAALVELQAEAIGRAAACTRLDALDAADLEDELLDVLDSHGVANAYRLTEPLVAARIDAAWLERVAKLAGPATGAAVEWIAASLTARGLTAEIAESTERMSDLVRAIKSYAYMDQGEVVQADIHEGLETTLAVLGHKLKHTHIAVERDYDRSLPPLQVRGAELNQVWTNLIDNAIAALGDEGTITIRTSRDGPCVLVDIGDDGPGIPAEVRESVFDPFFTTKGVGSGTGLGLDTARRIVEERHRGTLAVDSEPGATVFHVWLPFESTVR